MDAWVEFITSAMNSNRDLLVAGDYKDGYGISQSFVYLFDDSTCTYLWRLSGGESIQFPRAVAWGYD